MSPTEIITALKALLAALPVDHAVVDQSRLNANRRKQLRALIAKAIERLETLNIGLDPIRLPTVMFDPTNPDVVGRLIGETLIEQNRAPLDGLPKFYGSGVYSLYYNGKFKAYVPASGSDTPLYVGKADPAFSDARSPVEQGVKLWVRLGEHAKSIRSATNLDIADFECRYLVVKSAWQGTAEMYLINHFKPVWNNEVGICYGIGKHGDAAETRTNTRSPWDTVHPGRPWATKEGNRPNPLTAEQIIESILTHYKENPPRSRRS